MHKVYVITIKQYCILAICIAALVTFKYTASAQTSKPNPASRVKHMLEIADSTLKKEPQKAYRNYQQALLLINRSEGLDEQKAYAQLMMGKIRSFDTDNVSAIRLTMAALTYYQHNNNDKLLAEAYTSLGNINVQLQNNHTAFRYYDKAFEAYTSYTQKNNKDLQELYVYKGNLARGYMLDDQPEKAISLYHQLIIETKGNKDSMLLYSSNVNMARSFFKLANIDSALSYQNQALALARTMANEQLVLSSLCNIGRYYLNDNKLPLAAKYLYEAKYLGNDTVKVQASELFYLLYQLEKKRNDIPKALYFLEKKENADKLAAQTRSSNNLDAIISEYNLNINQQNISFLEKKSSAIYTTSVKKTYLIIAVMAIATLASILAMFYFRYWRLKNEQNVILQQLNKKVNEQKRIIENNNKTLEEQVSQRTQKLQEQYEKLLQFSFLNSHKVRGPLSRMLMTLHLKDIDGINDEDFQRIIDTSAKELDEVIHEINETLKVDLGGGSTKEGLINS